MSKRINIVEAMDVGMPRQWEVQVDGRDRFLFADHEVTHSDKRTRRQVKERMPHSISVFDKRLARTCLNTIVWFGRKRRGERWQVIGGRWTHVNAQPTP